MGILKQWNGLSAKRKTYWATLIIALGIGGLFGFALAPAFFDFGFETGQALQRGDPLPTQMVKLSPTLAIAMVVIFNVVVWPITWLWHRAVDEHEEQAALWGGLIAGYALIGLGGSWAVLSWAGLVPELSLGLAIIIFSFVWSAVWMYKKFR